MAGDNRQTLTMYSCGLQGIIMNDESNNEDDSKLPVSSTPSKLSRGALQVFGGAIPFIGGLSSAAAGAWSESEQEKVNRFFEH